MGALSGTTAERTQAALAAGCDVVLHCNGKLAEMREVAAHAPKLAGKALKRADAALAMRVKPEEFDRAEGRKTFAALIAADRPVLAQRGVRRLARKAPRRIAQPLGRNGRRRRS
jgi:beta-glucosidase-like glycosyl hydrolase